jgi:hypothetical protein
MNRELGIASLLPFLYSYELIVCLHSIYLPYYTDYYYSLGTIDAHPEFVALSRKRLVADI